MFSGTSCRLQMTTMARLYFFHIYIKMQILKNTENTGGLYPPQPRKQKKSKKRGNIFKNSLTLLCLTLMNEIKE